MNLRSKFIAACGVLALLAAAPVPKPPPVPRPVPDAVTHHTVHIGGASIAYTARAGTITLHNAKEQVTARMFYVAYTKDGADHTHRPVTFFYNGGPGSSSMWLHMGSYGPVHIVSKNFASMGPAPYRIVENPSSLLDKTDEVFVDAPNTGYSRVIGAGTPKDFMGVDQDGRAFTQFIQRYITQNDRWNSPKFLFGESYGTTRDCVLVNMLQESGVTMNGVVLLSSILNFQLGGLGPAQPIAGGDWVYVTYLPTEAATAWFHHMAGRGESLQAFLRNVETFAGGRYLHDLAQGSDLSQAAFNDDVERLHQYLGLSTQYIREANLRIGYRRFEKELLRNQNIVVGRLDSRYQTYDIDGVNDNPNWDPADVGFSGAFVSGFNQYVRDTLHYNSDLQYRPTAYSQLGAPWDFHHQGNDPPANVAPDLATAMTQNPHLQIFNGAGVYDFATPYFAAEYTLNHLNLAPALRKNITQGDYASGHMVYINPQVMAEFKNDLSRWYDRAVQSR